MVVGSNPSTVYWMDCFSHIFVVYIEMLFEKTKINEKEAGMVHLKKIVIYDDSEPTHSTTLLAS